MRMQHLLTLISGGLILCLSLNLSAQTYLPYERKYDSYVSGKWNCGSYGDEIRKINGRNITFWDMNNDGVPELIIGRPDGTIEVYEDEGTHENPCYFLLDDFFLGIQDSIGNIAPAFMDVNGDGLADMFVGNGIVAGDGGYIQLWLNTGTADSAAFTLAVDSIAGLDVHDASIPFPVDLDQDGDIDLLVGGGLGAVYFIENIGDPVNFNFNSSPQLIDDFSFRVSPVAKDLDGDGDFELYVLEAYGRIHKYIDTNPLPDVFEWEKETNDWLGIDLCESTQGCVIRPAFYDFDQDGDCDLLVSGVPSFHSLQVIRNIGDSTNFIPSKEFSSYPHLNEGYFTSFSDLNGDGLKDWFIDRGGRFSIYHQGLINGTENWSLTDEEFLIFQNYISNLAFYDFDNDGDLDLKAGMDNLTDGYIKSYKNVGNSSNAIFVPTIDSVLDTLGFHSMAVCAIADLDNDDLVDMLVLSGDQQVWHLEDATPDTTLHWEIVSESLIDDLPAATRSISLADIDGDGDLDFFASSIFGSRLYLNQGDQNNPDFVLLDDAFGGIGIGVSNDMTLADVIPDCGVEMIDGNKMYIYQGIMPEIEISVDSFCVNDGIQQLIAYPNNVGTGLWGGIADSNGQFDPSALDAGIHTVWYTYTDGFGCFTYSDTAEIVVANLLSADFDFELMGDTVAFFNLSNTDSLVWDFGDGNTSTSPNPIHQYSAPGMYEVCLNIFNQCDTVQNCQSVEIIALDSDDLESPPNEIKLSPNPTEGDLMIALSSNQATTYQVKIYSALGVQVFTTEGTSTDGQIWLEEMGLNPGIYLLEIITNNIKYTDKFKLLSN